jgi:hypothetical protein
VSGAFEIIDVSHALGAGTETYPGLPAPRIEISIDHETSRARYAGKSEFLIASYHLCGNTGTYVDAPLHRHKHGARAHAVARRRHTDLRAPDAARRTARAARVLPCSPGRMARWRYLPGSRLRAARALSDAVPR